MLIRSADEGPIGVAAEADGDRFGAVDVGFGFGFPFGRTGKGERGARAGLDDEGQFVFAVDDVLIDGLGEIVALFQGIQ